MLKRGSAVQHVTGQFHLPVLPLVEKQSFWAYQGKWFTFVVASEGRNAVLISVILQGMHMWNFIKTKCECVVIFSFVFIRLCRGCENITL